jgi:hypothetical protein
MTTHIKFNYEGTEYNFVVQVDKSQRIEMPTSDKMFIVSIEMHKNIIKVYHVSEEFWDANTKVHEQPIKKAIVRATSFLDWYLNDVDVLMDIAFDIKKILLREGEVKLTAFSIYKNCQYIPKSICFNIADDMDEYNPEDLLFMDDYGSFNYYNDRYFVL